MNLKFKIANIFLTALLSAAIHAQTVDWSQKANPANHQVNGVAFRADGQKVLSGTNCHPAAIRMFDVSTSDLEWDYTVGSQYLCIMGVTFSSNNNYIAAIEEFGNVFIFDNTGEAPEVLSIVNTGTSYAFSTAISPDNSQIAVGCSNGRMKIYNLPSGSLAANIAAHPNWVTSVAYSPDGNKIATGGSDRRVKIWTAAGTLIFNFAGHNGEITNVKVSPDNNFVVSSSRDKTIKIWDITTGVLVRTIAGHTGDVNGVDISPDGSKIVSVSADGSCKIWDFNTGNLLATFGVANTGAVTAVAWSPNGNKVATGNEQSDVVLWDISSITGTKSPSKANDFELTLFPNPASVELSAILPAGIAIARIDIADVCGRVVSSFGQAEISLAVGQLSPGLYYLSVMTTDNQRAIQPFVKY
ncbi:MAG: hypothetical protein ACK4NS_08045 [Saprospiraceae bacterium]